jgi:hypothetical protein
MTLVDALAWADAWSFTRFQDWTGRNVPPKSEDPAVAAWIAHIKNIPTIEAAIYESSSPGGRKSGRDTFNRSATRVVTQSGIMGEVDGVMQDRQCDARSIARATKLRILPEDGLRYCLPHISQLAMNLFGNQAFELVGQDVLMPRLNTILSIMFQQAWSRQVKDLQTSSEDFDKKLSIVKSSIEGLSLEESQMMETEHNWQIILHMPTSIIWSSWLKNHQSLIGPGGMCSTRAQLTSSTRCGRT